MSTRGKLIVSISVLCTLVAFLTGFVLLSKTQMEHLYRNYGFYFILVAFALWLQKLIDLTAGNFLKIKAWFAGNYQAVIAAVVVIFLLAMAIPAEYRILADETNLLGISLSMYETQECCNPTEAIFSHHGKVNFLETVVDMRPAFYSFLVFIGHAVLGYDPGNAFVINLLAGFLILALLYYFVARYLDSRWGMISMLLLASFPLFAIYVRSAGFETVNLACLMLLSFFLCLFVNKKSVETAEMMLLTLPLLAQTRYESALAVFVALAVLVICLDKSDYQHLTARVLLLPLLFLPVAWLRVITWSGKNFQVTDVGQAFGIDIFIENVQRAVPFFFGQKPEYAMIPLLGLLACAGLIKLVFDLASGTIKFDKSNRIFWGSIFFLVLLHAAARFFYFWGNLTLQYASRLGLVFLPVIVGLSAYLCASVQKHWKIKNSWFAVSAALLLINAWPAASQNIGVRDILFFREFKTVKSYLSQKYSRPSQVMVLSELANFYTPFRYSAMYIGNVRKNPGFIENLLKERKFTRVIAIQRVNPTSQEVSDSTKLPGNFRLKILDEFAFNRKEIIRISAVELP